MDRHTGLPGIDSLFRQHERLAKKLSQEELNALRRYLQRAVHTECESVVARMRYLQSAHDVNETQYQRALSTLQKDLRVQRTLAGEFRREFGSLARVLESREQRWRDRQETLTGQVLESRKTADAAVKAKLELESELQQRQKELDQQKDAVVDLEDELANHRHCYKLRQEMTQLSKDLLKAKLENDLLRKDLAKITSKLDEDPKKIIGHSSSYKASTSAFKPTLERQDKNHHVHFATTPVAAKNKPMTFATVTPYCTTSTCRARQDLEECRVQFIKKCEEVVALKTALSELKSKMKSLSQERTKTTSTTTTSREFGVRVSSGGNPSGPNKKSASAVDPLKPGYQRGREAVRVRHGSTRLYGTLKSLKSRPVFQ